MFVFLEQYFTFPPLFNNFFSYILAFSNKSLFLQNQKGILRVKTSIVPPYLFTNYGFARCRGT